MEIENNALTQNLPSNYKHNFSPLTQSLFKIQYNDNTSPIHLQLYEDAIIYWNTTVKPIIKKILRFSFDLRFQLLRKPSQNVSQKKKLNPPCGIKFDTSVDQTLCFFSENFEELIIWRNFLATKLNQRGFHELFKPIKKIGKGNFASVYLAERLQDNQKFAIKAFSKEATYSEQKGKQSLVNQIQLMRKLNHNNIMKLYEVYQSQNSIYISVELLEGGQLYDKIKLKHKFTLIQIKTVLLGLLKGLQHMHSKRIMHRDLKPENILIRKQGSFECVIADFGLATWADQKQYLFVRCGTPGYVAPQIVNIKNLNQKSEPICDIFSLGLIFHIMLVGRSAFPGKTYNQVLSQNRACDFKIQGQQFYKFGTDAVDLLKKMLEKDPKLRIPASDCLNHPFLITDQKSQQQLLSQKLMLTKKSSSSTMQSVMSPLLTSANPYRKKDQLLKQDSCLKFKMQQSILTGKLNALEQNNQNILTKKISNKCSAMQNLNQNQLKTLSKFAKKSPIIQSQNQEHKLESNYKSNNVEKGFLTPYNR